MSKSKRNDDIREHVPSVDKEHFGALLGKNPLPVFILDVETGNPEEYLFLAANKAACDQYGYSEDELRKMKMLNIHLKEDIQEVLEDVAPSRNSRYGEFSSTRPGRHVKKDGSIIYVDVTSNRIIYEGRQARVAITRNITERIQAIRSLRESEENLRRMLDAVEDLVYVCTSDYKIVFINKAFTEELQKEAAGKSCYEAVFDRDKPCVGCNLGGVIEGETERYEITNDRSGRIYDVIHTPFSKVDGTLCAIHFMKDITERKQAEEALKKAKEDLEKKNEEMEAFVYTAAHDLRTPLISVRGFLSLMKKQLKGKLDEKSEYHLERVMKNAEHFDNLLGDLLQFSQVGADTGQKEEINLSAVAREIAYETARSYDIEASLVISEKLPIVNMQSSRVHQLLENLISNSVKFKRSGIPLELEIGIASSEDNIPAGHAPIYVRDNGVGIEEDIQGAIFGLFSRPAVNSEEGTGVGLAIVKRIIEEEGGSIRVQSTPGEGTTFYFSLPCVGTSF